MNKMRKKFFIIFTTLLMVSNCICYAEKDKEIEPVEDLPRLYSSIILRY